MGEKLRAGTLYFINNEGEFKKLGVPVSIEGKNEFFGVDNLIIEVSEVVNKNEFLYETRYGKYVSERGKVELPTRYIINQDATILFFSDETKIVVKRCKDDEFNPRLAFLTAFFQKYCGMSKNKANKYLANLQVEETKNIKEKEYKPKRMKEEN